MAKKTLTVTTLLFFLVGITGCWDLREINASVIATCVGVELAPKNRVVVTAQLLQAQSSSEIGSSSNKPIAVSAADYSVAGAARRLMLSLSLVPEWSHVNAFLLGEDLIRTDLGLCIDFMTRNRNARPDSDLLICRGTTPEKVLMSQLPEGSNLGTGLMDMLKQNQRVLGIYVPMTLEEFTYRLTTPGIEPTVPQITLAEPGNSAGANVAKNPGKVAADNKKLTPVLNGMAVFKKNRMVGSLSEYESRGYRWMNSTTRTGGLFTIRSPLNPKEIVGFEILGFQTRVKPQISGDNIKMIIQVKAYLGFYEQTGTGDLLRESVVPKLEAGANREIERQISACIEKSQLLGSDINGWGRMINMYEPEIWQALYPDWPSIYPSVESDIQVKTVITRSYYQSKSFRFQ